MKAIVAGGDGFIGWPLSLALSHAGHEVLILDNFARRSLVRQIGSDSLVPLLPLDERLRVWRSVAPRSVPIQYRELDVASDMPGLLDVVAQFAPDTLVHLATMPSAPYSMKTHEAASFTVANNVQATFHVLWAVAEHAPTAHVVHIGTMGVYGYDAEDYKLPEGYLQARVALSDGTTKDISILHPMKPGSVYHLTKAQDQLFFEFFNRQRDLRITDLHQGIVWGANTELTSIDEGLATRFDYDSDFGTVLNRFAAQAAIGHPLTLYGSGTQTRAFIHLRDSIECLLLAIGNPPELGDRVRIFNQFTQMFSVNDVANLVARVGNANIGPIENPRIEREGNVLSAFNAGLLELGLRPTLLAPGLVREILDIASRHRARINPGVIRPMSFWRRSSAK